MAIGQLFSTGDKLWEFKRHVSKSRFIKDEKIDMDFLKEFKEWIGVDHVLENQTHFIFVNEITEPEWEELKIETN